MDRQEIALETAHALHENLAPQLVDCDLAKKIVALQMCSMPEEKEKIHILMVGSPASGKSELMGFIHKCIPHSVRLDKRTTPVGLVEATEVSDRGLTMMDEFDKVAKPVRQQLLEAMQDQVITVHKFGFHETFPRRMNILAACNPDNGTVQDGRPIVAQIKRFSPVLLSRFHFIIKFNSIASERYGEIAVKHNVVEENLEDLQRNILSMIIEMKRKVPKVTISPKLARKSGDAIDFLKKATTAGFRRIITYRTVEGFLSCLKARARMNLRSNPNDDDFKYVRKLFEQVYML